jgi:hypothetical protein
LVILTSVFHIVFIALLDFDKVAWKKTDYVWIGIGALGLISMTANSRIILAKDRLEFATERTTFALQQLRISLEIPSRHFCTKFVRSEFSPPDLENMQKEFDAACAWLKTAPNFLPASSNPPFKPLKFSDTNFPNWITDKGILDEISMIRWWFDEYERRRKNVEKLLAQAKPEEGKYIYELLGPILICIATALRLAKVTGEIRLERVK